METLSLSEHLFRLWGSAVCQIKKTFEVQCENCCSLLTLSGSSKCSQCQGSLEFWENLAFCFRIRSLALDFTANYHSSLKDLFGGFCHLQFQAKETGSVWLHCLKRIGLDSCDWNYAYLFHLATLTCYVQTYFWRKECQLGPWACLRTSQ